MANFNYHTRSKRLLGDLYTPVSLYMRLRDLYPQSMLMESSDYHGNDNAKSFIGIHPMASIQVSHGMITMLFPDGSSEKRPVPEENSDKPKRTVAKAINDFLASFHVEGEGKQYYGIFGFTSANAVRYFENIPVKDVTMQRNDAPDIYYILFKDLIVFDHFNNMTDFMTLTPDNASASEADEDLQLLLKAANKPAGKPYSFQTVGETTSTLTDEEHKANIRRCVSHCMRGDVFQIVISRRFIQRYEGDDFQLYRALRSINPSPYLFYFDFGGYRIFGSSPETHNRRAMQSRTAAMLSSCATTRRRMPSTSCWWISHAMT